eukprot:scpid35374/ scgid21944/ 
MSSKFGTALEANSINLDSYAKKRELFVVSEEKLDKAGGHVEGHIDMNYHRICHLGYDGVSSTCAAPTGWVTSEIGKVDTSLRNHVDDDETRLMVSGTLKMKGNLDMGGMEIVNVKQPSRSTSVVTSEYLNTALSRTLWTFQKSVTIVWGKDMLYHSWHTEILEILHLMSNTKYEDKLHQSIFRFLSHGNGSTPTKG